MNRNERQLLAAETLEILRRGGYDIDGRFVDIAGEVEACARGTRLYTPPVSQRIAAVVAPENRATRVTVANETTLAAARRIAADPDARVAALNFASARHPGGGFQTGAQAQKESIARASSLYPALLTCPSFYDDGRRANGLYTDQIIHSPDVVVFRDDDGKLLDEPYLIDILTAAAPNAGAVRSNEPRLADRIDDILRQRARLVLAVAADQGISHLILGAWGCGVFRNDPAVVAEAFAQGLSDQFAGSFTHVHFAVLDRPGGTIFDAFQRQFQKP